MRPRWYRDQRPVTFNLELDGGQSHRVTWRSGRLVLGDHDLAGERVLAALGGDSCPCLTVLDAIKETGVSWPERRPRQGIWHRMIASSPPKRPWTSLPLPGLIGRPTPPQMQARVIMASLRNDPNFRRLGVDQQRQMLSSFRQQLIQDVAPDEWLELLARMARVRTGRLAHHGDRRRPIDVDARLQSAAAPQIEEAMGRSRRDLRPYATLTVEVWKQPAPEWPSIKGSLDSGGGFAAVFLPVRWLNRVWLRGIAVVDGHFIAEVDEGAPATQLQAQAVRWERQASGSSLPVLADCTVLRRGSTWELRW